MGYFFSTNSVRGSTSLLSRIEKKKVAGQRKKKLRDQKKKSRHTEIKNSGWENVFDQGLIFFQFGSGLFLDWVLKSSGAGF